MTARNVGRGGRIIKGTNTSSVFSEQESKEIVDFLMALEGVKKKYLNLLLKEKEREEKEIIQDP